MHSQQNVKISIQAWYSTVQIKLNPGNKKGQNPLKEKQISTKGRTQHNQIPIFPLR